MAQEALELFIRCGIEEKTAKNAVSNAKVTANLTEVIFEAGMQNGCDKNLGNLLNMVSTKYPANALTHRKKFLAYLTSVKIKSIPQLEAAFAYLSSVGAEPLDEMELSYKSGVGVEVSLDEIKKVVSEVIEKEKEKLLVERYRTNVGVLLGKVRAIQPWADGKVAREELDAQLKALLGERTAEDDEKPKKKDKKKKEKPSEEGASGNSKQETPAAAPSELVSEPVIDPYAQFPDPKDNIQVHTEIFFSNGDTWRPHNTREALNKHLAATAGKVMTRFPPEPNGYLHIGHAKAMNVSFGLARERDGFCYLRFDDTNPEAEKQEYIEHIQEIVAWLGWKPFKVTYSSDYFEELYQFAVQLIKDSYAYVDHQSGDEIKESRENGTASPWRNRPVAESLALFEDMKRGLVAEGQATLRVKQDIGNANPNLWDQVAYRIKFSEHPHAGDKWCIYPSYDFTHCIVDSLENITHSLCTLEFETRRASYYWLLEALQLYHPYVWEYARLSITSTVMSKRKLNRLVTEGHVRGWDDPRLMTLAGLRRRGASPEAINAFCRALGITRSDNLIKQELLEHFLRDDLNRSAPRVLVVLHPLKLVIGNFPEGAVEYLDAKSFPDAREGDPEASYKVPFTRDLFIESSDFRLKDSKDYYGLAPGKTIMLRYAYPVTFREVVFEPLDPSQISHVVVDYDPTKSTKPKGVVHWVADTPSALAVEVRLIDKLFLAENPAELGDEWLKDLNPESLKVVHGAKAVPSLKSVKPGDKFQFERLGYFCVDTDSTPDKLVFNRTVTLRDSYAKGK